MRKILAAAISLTLPAAAMAQDEMQTIIVTAPKTVSAEDAKRWEQFNRNAAKIEKRLAKLYDERRDDVSDVKEARDTFEDAKDKLEDEKKDMRRTARNIAKAENRLREIARQRALLR